MKKIKIKSFISFIALLKKLYNCINVSTFADYNINYNCKAQ